MMYSLFASFEFHIKLIRIHELLHYGCPGRVIWGTTFIHIFYYVYMWAGSITDDLNNHFEVRGRHFDLPLDFNPV